MNNTPNFCRFCAVSKPSSKLCDLTSDTEKLEEIKRRLTFLKITFVNLSDDILPKGICDDCFKNLKSCCIVFDRIRESQEVLSDLFSNEGNTKRQIQSSVIFRKRDEPPSNYVPKLEIDESVTETDRVLTPAQQPQTTRAPTWPTYPKKCDQCRKSCKSLLDLKEHCNFAHGSFTGFKCADCAITVPTFHPFIQHVREHRPELIEYCPICNIKTNDPNHISSHPESFLDQTIFVLPNTEDSRKTKINERDLSRFFGGTKVRRSEINSWKEYPWVCQPCGNEFQDQAVLRIHLKEVHGKCFGFKCLDCPTVTKKFDMFINHVTMHRPNLEKKCHYCDFEVTDRKQYVVHIGEHSLDFKCSVCGEFFHDKTVLRTHKFIYNAPKSINKPRRHTETSLIMTDLTCDICGMVCARPHSLRRHKMIHNSTRQSQAHMEVHDKPYKCSQCTRRFRLNSHLRSHMYQHSDETPFNCRICDMRFKYKNILTKHERSHAIPNFDPFCNKSLATRSDYNTQMNTEKPPSPKAASEENQRTKCYDAEILKDWAEIMMACKSGEDDIIDIETS